MGGGVTELIGEDRNGFVAAKRDFASLFPRLSENAGPELRAAWLHAFLDDFPSRDWERLERFRAFPLFLRNEKRLGRLPAAHWVDMALWEWAAFSALYSPADETRDRRSLQTGEYALNPTAQILRLEHDLDAWFAKVDSGGSASEWPRPSRQMVFLFRAWDPSTGFRVRRHVADPSTAAVIDPLLENGRLLEGRLLAEIHEHHGLVRAARSNVWLEKLRSLAEEQLLLAGAWDEPPVGHERRA